VLRRAQAWTPKARADNEAAPNERTIENDARLRTRW